MVKGGKSSSRYHEELGGGSACLEVIAAGRGMLGGEVEGRAGLATCSLYKKVSLTGAVGAQEAFQEVN